MENSAYGVHEPAPQTTPSFERIIEIINNFLQLIERLKSFRGSADKENGKE
jgi:hypothetical protein